MASKAAALAMLALFLALVVTSIPSSVADGKKNKACLSVEVKSTCGKLLNDAHDEREHVDSCCNYLKDFDDSEAPSCLCKALDDNAHQPGKDQTSDEATLLNKVLYTCHKTNVTSDYDCSSN